VEGRRLCFVDLAKLHEFDLQIDIARARFREAGALPPGKGHSRVLREFASFEKRQGNLEVSLPLVICWDSVALDI